RQIKQSDDVTSMLLAKYMILASYSLRKWFRLPQRYSRFIIVYRFTSPLFITASISSSPALYIVAHAIVTAIAFSRSYSRQIRSPGLHLMSTSNENPWLYLSVFTTLQLLVSLSSPPTTSKY